MKPSKSKRQQDINVKVQFINSPFEQNSVVRKLSNCMTLGQLVEMLQSELGAMLDAGYDLKFQTFTKTVGVECLDLTLSQVGVENNGVLRISFNRPTVVEKKQPGEPSAVHVEKSNKTVDTDTTMETAKTEEIKLSPEEEAYKNVLVQQIKAHFSQVEDETGHDEMDIDGPVDREEPVKEEPMKEDPLKEEPKEVPKHVYVFKASETPLEVDQPDEEVYELSVSHARQYQNMLSSYAHDSEKKRRIRKEAQKRRINNVEVRIRFPDQSFLQANFKPNETNADLYKFVSNSLAKENVEFELSIPHPHEVLATSTQPLITQLDARNLLLFRSQILVNGPFLKHDFLQQAKDMREAEEIKLDKEFNHVHADDTTQIESLKVNSPTTKNSTHNNGKKIPKWLKLGKS